jgi:hypothetical protein
MAFRWLFDVVEGGRGVSRRGKEVEGGVDVAARDAGLDCHWVGGMTDGLILGKELEGGELDGRDKVAF